MRNFFALLILVLTMSSVNAQDTLFMYKAGAVISKYALPDVDSITFVRGTKPIVKDIDGNEYDLVVIGTQTWFRQNLKTTRYNDGAEIPLITSENEWAALTSPGRCYYNNDSITHKNTYGALYNWYVVNTGKLCPTGFHVPSKIELTTLVDYLGGATLAGGKLKEPGTLHWSSPNTDATNLSGFTGVSIGGRNYAGVYWLKGQNANFWSTTPYDQVTSWSMNLHYNKAALDIMYTTNKTGVSVRCLKN